jgi:hypothetical protein
MNTNEKICHDKIEKIISWHGVKELFSGSGYSCERPHAYYIYEPEGIYLRVYPEGNLPNKKYFFYLVTAN